MTKLQSMYVIRALTAQLSFTWCKGYAVTQTTICTSLKQPLTMCQWTGSAQKVYTTSILYSQQNAWKEPNWAFTHAKTALICQLLQFSIKFS